MKERILVPYIKAVAGDTETPITLYYKYVGKDIGFLLESRGEGGKSEYSFMGKNPQAMLVGREDLEIYENGKCTKHQGVILDNVRNYIENYNVKNTTEIPFVGGAVGCIGYDIIKQYENLPKQNTDVIGNPDVHLMVITELIAYDHLHDKIYIVVLEEDTEDGKKRAEEKLNETEKSITEKILPVLYNDEPKAPIKVVSNTIKEEYTEKVKKAKQYIYDGDIFQVVISQRLTATTEEEPLVLYRKLRTINPSPYLFYFNFGEYQVAGSSPEMLVEHKNGRVYTCPIAGTRKRGKNKAEDARLAEDLRSDEKEQAEHVMLVDLARNDMGRVSKIGTVEVSDFMRVQNYSHVMHMVSLVEGDKTEDKDSFDVLSTFLPAGTLSGAPKIRAMEIIEELETEKRGLYGGSAGYFAFDGNMDFCIAIRTMVIKDGKVYMQAGAGIVADSDPLAEYEECHNKLRALVKTIGGDI